MFRCCSIPNTEKNKMIKNRKNRKIGKIGKIGKIEKIFFYLKK